MKRDEGAGVAEQLRYFRYEIGSTVLSVEEVGGCETGVASLSLVALGSGAMGRSAVNGDVVGVLKKSEAVDYSAHQSLNQSNGQA